MDQVPSYGLPESALKELESFDPLTAKLEDLLDSESRMMARHFICDAINMSRVDGYHTKEREDAVKAAEILGVDRWVVASIEGILEAEDGLRRARLSVLSPPNATI